MTKADELQRVINQSSLMMNNIEDITKAVKVAEVHPKLAEVLIRMHGQQMDLNKAVTELRTGQLELAKVLDRLATHAGVTTAAMEQLAKHMNVETTELFAPEKSK